MRKLVLLAVMAAAAMAFMAPSAFAVVEVEDSASGVMCDNSAAGYCETSWGADLATLTVHTIFGDVDYVCDVSIPVHVQSNGALSSESVSFVNEAGGSGNCGDLTPCEEPWTGQLSETAGSEFLSADICIDGVTRCEGQLHSPALTDTGSGYTAELNDIEIENNTACEFSGHYAADGIEIHHLESAAFEVEASASSTMCDDTTAGYCEIDWESDLATLTIHTIFGDVDYVCDVTIPVHVQSNGALSSESVSFVNEAGGSGNCGDLTPCEEPWTGQLSETAGSEFLSADICIDGVTRCEGQQHSPALTDTGSGYAAELNDIEIEGNTACEFSGHYAADGIRIHHP